MEEGHCVRTIHAEANAIAWSARKGIAIEGATLYTYGWESGICHRCRKLALSAGIVKIVEIPMETAEDASFFKGETINFDDKTAGEPQRVHECGDPNCIVPHPAPHKKRPA
jgi:deoxycytidylate deaminase